MYVRALYIMHMHIHTIPLDLNLTLTSTYSRAPTPFLRAVSGCLRAVLRALVHDLHMTLASIYARER